MQLAEMCGCPTVNQEEGKQESKQEQQEEEFRLGGATSQAKQVALVWLGRGSAILSEGIG
jgi:hypothetical protein